MGTKRARSSVGVISILQSSIKTARAGTRKAATSSFQFYKVRLKPCKHWLITELGHNFNSTKFD